nr:mitogen-activated protein kinase 19 [Tanacetum cinerariifolium]
MPTVKQGRMIGPVLPYEEVYDPRVLVKNAVAPPQYVYMTSNGGDQGTFSGIEPVRGPSSMVPHPQMHQQTGAAKLAGGIVIDLNSNPYYIQPHAHVHQHGSKSSVNSSMIASRPQQTLVTVDNRRVIDNTISSGRVTDASGNAYQAAAPTRPPPRMPTVKQGRMIGPVLPYEEGLSKS